LQETETNPSTFDAFGRMLLDPGFLIVILGFSFLAIVNLLTYALGALTILRALNSSPLGILFSPFIFDSWGTVFGLLGVILLFSPVLLGARKSLRKALAVFLLLNSVIVGIASTAIWSYYFNPGGQLPYGASSIAISAQAIIFTMSIAGMVQLFVRGSWISTKDPYWRRSLGVIYATLAATTLWFILFLEPIFVPTSLYNWRVHEIAFLVAAISSIFFLVIATRHP